MLDGCGVGKGMDTILQTNGSHMHKEPYVLAIANKLQKYFYEYQIETLYF